MSSNIKVKRICDFCGESFEARTTVTRFCSHRCNSRYYKSVARGKKIVKSNSETTAKVLRPMEMLKAKEYLSVNEACKLIGVSRMTLHRQIKSRRLKATTIGRRIIIRREDIDTMLL